MGRRGGRIRAGVVGVGRGQSFMRAGAEVVGMEPVAGRPFTVQDFAKEASRATVEDERWSPWPESARGIQPLATFPSLCKFMMLLHDVTGNPEREFPRMSPD